ncbi:MAG: hypothetical protein AAGD35_11665 [Actinomycetota bacterium]
MSRGANGLLVKTFGGRDNGGLASQWALAAEPGTEIDATMLGSKFEMPDPMPTNVHGHLATPPPAIE